MLLQRRPSQKTAELAQELGVSVRSIHRYIAMLDDMGIPVYSQRGPYGGFSLVRSNKIPPLVFNPEEAVAVYLGTSQVGEMWGQLYQDAARGALAKLDNVVPDEQRHEVRQRRRVARWPAGDGTSQNRCSATWCANRPAQLQCSTRPSRKRLNKGAAQQRRQNP